MIKKRMKSLIESHSLQEMYIKESICIFPPEFSISSSVMRRITNELIWGTKCYPSDRSYETIWNKASSSSSSCLESKFVIEERKVFTRFENFVKTHPAWNVFLTYNPLEEGDYHDLYYTRVKEL